MKKIVNSRRLAAIITSLFVVLSLAGCGNKILRRPVPQQQINSVSVMGMDNIRAWEDEFDPVFQRELKQAMINYKTYREKIGEMPKETSVLLLSGGGADGAFGAGLLKGWTEQGTRPKFRAVSGVSTGALIAPFAFLGKDYDGLLEHMYTSMTPDKIYVLKSIFSIFGSDSLTSSAPLRKIVSDTIDEKILKEIAKEYAKGRLLFVSTTNLDANRGVVWNMGAIASYGTKEALQLFRNVLIASAAVPVAFPPVYIPVTAGGKKYDEMHVDGGVISPFFLYGPIVNLPKARRDAGFERPEQINMYIVLNNRMKSNYGSVKPNLKTIAGDSVSLLIRSQGVWALYAAYTLCQRDDIQFNYVSIPNKNYPERDEEFDNAAINQLFDMGYSLWREGELWEHYPPGYMPK